MTVDNNNSKMNELAVPFDDAIERAGFGLYSYLLIALTGLSIISYACVIYSSTLLVPINACELMTTDLQQSMLVAMPLVGSILGAIVWGYLGDTKGRRNMLLISFISGAAVNALASISVNWIMLMLMQFLAASLAAGQYSLAMTLLSECVPVKKRSLVVLIVASIFLLAQGIMSLLAMPIVDLDFSQHLPALDIYWNPWRTVILLYSVPSLICCACLFFMQESPKFVLSKGDEARALKILTIIHRLNNRKSKEELQVKGLILEESVGSADDKKEKPIRELFRRPLLKYFLIMTALAVFMKGNPFLVWLPTIANRFMDVVGDGAGDQSICMVIDSTNVNSINATISSGLALTTAPDSCKLDQTALLIVFGVGVLQSLLNLMLSFVVDRIGRRNTVIIVAAVCGVSGILVNIVPNTIGSAVLFVIFLLSLVLTGINTTIAVALFPTHLRVLAVSLTMTGGRIALIADTVILNFLLNNYCLIGFYVYTALFTTSTVIASLLPDDRKQRIAAEKEAETDTAPQSPQLERSRTSL